MQVGLQIRIFIKPIFDESPTSDEIGFFIMEIFKDIPNYEGLYQVSNLGIVKSRNRVVKNRWEFYVLKGKKIKGSINSDGYIVVRLSKNKIEKDFKTHQLVAMAFLGHKPCGNKLVIDHINNKKSDNRLENLQITTQRHNAT